MYILTVELSTTSTDEVDAECDDDDEQQKHKDSSDNDNDHELIFAAIISRCRRVCSHSSTAAESTEPGALYIKILLLFFRPWYFIPRV